ncbi:MAG TPA: helix-turn-helix domain-containing protein [Longimicrobiales bacterium]
MAEYLRLAEVTVRKMVRRRQLPVIRIGRRVLFDPSDIRSWLQTRKERAA